METNVGTIKPCTHKHFIIRLLNNKQPYIFEDGNQTRNFIRARTIGFKYSYLDEEEARKEAEAVKELVKKRRG